MVEKVYITNTNMATFICPQCKKTLTVDVSKYAQMEQTVKVKSKCSCGNEWISVLEKRKQYRKGVNLKGIYKHIVDGEEMDRGKMTIVDISAGGVKLKLDVDRSLKTGHLLKLEFKLNDSKQTPMQKIVIIRNANSPYYGAAFKDADHYDPVMGFYLMS
ncbi:PilZ domain-containing protein [Thermodesulfobacteriota bacterium]